MGYGARQLRRTAGVGIGETESDGFAGGFASGGEERKRQGFIVVTNAMRKLWKGFCAADVMREVQRH